VKSTEREVDFEFLKSAWEFREVDFEFLFIIIFLELFLVWEWISWNEILGLDL